MTCSNSKLFHRGKGTLTAYETTEAVKKEQSDLARQVYLDHMVFVMRSLNHRH